MSTSRIFIPLALIIQEHKMIGTKIILVGLILLVVGAALYFIALGESRASTTETIYNECTSVHGPDFPECANLIKSQSDNPLRVWGFIIGVVGILIIVLGILVALLLRRPRKEKIVEKEKVVEKVLYKCPKCGSENDTNDEFCKKCGKQLKPKAK